MALKNKYAPYVHSNLIHLNESLVGTRMDRNSTEGKKRLQDLIEKITQMRDELKAATL